jgi:glucose/mannose-6-phosphate isomerase
MDQLIGSFSEHLKHAMRIGRDATLVPDGREIRNVMISGLGGSGIGGTVTAQIVANECRVPVQVNKTYHLPASVDEHTLVIISSYSGNTEETVSAFKVAMKRGAQVVCITSGGYVLEQAETKGLNHIVIPGGNPPRSMFGYNITQLFYVLSGFGLISNAFEAQFEAAIALLDDQEETIRAEAKALAAKLQNTTPVIYAAAPYEGVAIRFRQQINENAKMLGWHNVLPEMNHNELVGWAGGNDNLAVVIFRCEDDFDRTRVRVEISKTIFSKHTQNINEVAAKGNSTVERSLYLVHFGDWVSMYLAELNNVDVIEVKVIDFLKAELAKL